MTNFLRRIKKKWKVFFKKKARGTSSIELLFFALASILLFYVGSEVYNLVKMYVKTQEKLVEKSKKKMNKRVEKIKQELLEDEENEDNFDDE